MEYIVTSVLPRAFAARYLVMPLTVERTTLTIATADPWDLETLDHICKLTGLEVKTVVSPKSDILKAITEFYGFKMSVSAAERRQLDVQSDLRNLVTAQESYFADNVTYASTTTNLSFNSSTGVTVSVATTFAVLGVPAEASKL